MRGVFSFLLMFIEIVFQFVLLPIMPCVTIRGGFADDPASFSLCFLKASVTGLLSARLHGDKDKKRLKFWRNANFGVTRVILTEKNKMLL